MDYVLLLHQTRPNLFLIDPPLPIYSLISDTDDTEGLLTNLGVVAALMLTLQLTLVSDINQKEWLLNEYRQALVNSPNFRLWTLDQLLRTDIYEPIQEGIVDPYTGRQFNISDAIERTSGFGSENTFNVVRTFILGSEEDRQAISLIEMIFLLTKDTIDLNTVAAWLFINGHNLQSTLVGSWTSGLSTVLFSLVLIGSVFLYLGLAMSDARTEAQHEFNASLEKFNEIAIPIILYLYLLLIFGSIVFFFGYTYIVQVRHPFYETSNQWFVWLIILAFGVSFFLYKSLKAWRKATDRVKRAERRAAAAKKSGHKHSKRIKSIRRMLASVKRPSNPLKMAKIHLESKEKEKGKF
ncbi:hypothetical protein TrLO_g1513 [Triparma laevis f. longispina]|uniref:Uncharacterized protein n=1 Tax=Triparma laevis f. longispina TaxID=1714387 RepID=A0A9W7ASY1_9STRA|nr:hypothetical protein TrLO_g1513 [Triparma laevis f. longispina]